MKIFIGIDKRQPVAYNVLRFSIERRAKKPVTIQPLIYEWMPVQRKGLTEFTYTRYLVPYLCNYEGEALFIDADMLVLDDIHNLEKLVDKTKAVSVVKNPIRFEWPSLMYFNNELCKDLTPELVATGKPMTFEWAKEVGELPTEWNHLVGYDQPNEQAKLVHFTRGIPCFPETIGCEYSDAWNTEAQIAMATVPWQEIMGGSVHKPINNLGDR
jgi:hypothetical protein